MDADTFKGLAIVSIAEGTKLGRVKDVLFDLQDWRVAALLVGGDGQSFVIPFEKITRVGPDAVTVASSQVTQIESTGDAFSDLLGLGRLRKLKVVDEAGTYLGTVAAIDIDGTTGRVATLAVHQGGLLGLGGTTTTLEAAAIRAVGPELITVATDVATHTPD